MRKRMGSLILLLAAGALIGTLVRTRVPVAVAEQTQLPRTPDGKPDLNGIWQAIGTAHWDLEDHSARAGAMVPLGAVGAVPAGKTVVQGGEIPYQPWAAAKKEENAAQWLTLDPEIKCYLPGVPRVMYLPFPFQIVQSPGFMLIGSEYVGATRSIHMEDVEPPPIDTFMGHSVGHWEGDTLVIESNSFNDLTWFDRAGNFHSEALRVVERMTPISRDALRYEATIEDSQVFTRPWTIQPAPVSPTRAGCRDSGVQLRGVRGRDAVGSSEEAGERLTARDGGGAHDKEIRNARTIAGGSSNVVTRGRGHGRVGRRTRDRSLRDEPNLNVDSTANTLRRSRSPGHLDQREYEHADAAPGQVRGPGVPDR